MTEATNTEAATEAETVAREPIKAPKTFPKGHVVCRVLKAGDAKISKGVHGLNGEEYFAKGDEFATEKTIADNLEDRGFIEVQ